MGSTTLWCRGCGAALAPGAALSVTPTGGGPGFVLCRRSVSPRCFAVAGSAAMNTIREFDPAAAAEFDRAARGAPLILSWVVDGEIARSVGEKETARHSSMVWANEEEME